MTFVMTVRKLKSLLPLMVTVHLSFGQVPATENALFWEIRAEGIEKPSYIFGSHHLLNSHTVDTLFNVLDKFQQSNAMLCELIFDNTQSMKMVQAAIMRDSTLDQLLSPHSYAATEQWLTELSQYESLAPLNSLNPAAIQLLLTNLLFARHYGESSFPMDIYMQQKASEDGKPLTELETFDEQIHVLFRSSTYRKQAEKLSEMVAGRDSALTELKKHTDLYLAQDLKALLEMTRAVYDQNEMDKLLFDRNTRWIKTIVQAVRDRSMFIMVGALHLPGDRGLIQQLRNLGFSVVPVTLGLPQ